MAATEVNRLNDNDPISSRKKTELIEQVTKVKTVIEKNKGEDRSIVREISWFVGRPSSSFTYFEGFEEI